MLVRVLVLVLVPVPGLVRVRVLVPALVPFSASLTLTLALAVTLAACSADDDGDLSPADASMDRGPGFDAAVSDPTLYEFPCLEPWEPTGASTYRSVLHELLCTHGCAAPYCHGSRGAPAGLSFETEASGYAALLQTEPDPLSLCAPRLRVVPGEPEASLLYLKVTGQAGCGEPMPPPDSGWPAFTQAEIEQLAAWIAAGAPAN